MPSDASLDFLENGLNIHLILVLIEGHFFLLKYKTARDSQVRVIKRHFRSLGPPSYYITLVS